MTKLLLLLGVFPFWDAQAMHQKPQVSITFCCSPSPNKKAVDCVAVVRTLPQYQFAKCTAHYLSPSGTHHAIPVEVVENEAGSTTVKCTIPVEEK